jgi:hypothetical protein
MDNLLLATEKRRFKWTDSVWLDFGSVIETVVLHLFSKESLSILSCWMWKTWQRKPRWCFDSF